ncbi:MAG: hypothetical protein ACKOAO_03905 [Oxalobacteraceae bacterium]
MNWQPYIRASWEIVLECESRSQLFLDEELEAYLVHMMARNFRKRDFPPEIVCLEFSRARSSEDFRQIGDGCLFVDAWDLRRAKLVNRDYYEKMGQAAYVYAASVARPMDQLLNRLAREFSLLSRVLRVVKPALV